MLNVSLLYIISEVTCISEVTKSQHKGDNDVGFSVD